MIKKSALQHDMVLVFLLYLCSNTLVISNKSGTSVNVFDLSAYQVIKAVSRAPSSSSSTAIKHAGELVIHDGAVLVCRFAIITGHNSPM